jgi:hypothetical protein
VKHSDFNARLIQALVLFRVVRAKKKIVEKPPRNSAGFCGGGQGLSWAVEPRKERKKFRPLY